MREDTFLPAKYELPDSKSGYMKFKQGANTFRVLSSAIVGYESWVEEDGKRKPLRWKMGVSIPVEQGENAKHFWAFNVWNFDEKKVQILEITQKGIMKAIKALTSNEKWGDPKTYNIVVTRTGEGMETEYQVQPEPKEELDKGIQQFYKDLKINLEALFKGENPFESVEDFDIPE
jgi:hypothetical protein